MNLQEFEASLRAQQYDEVVPMERAVGYQLGEHSHPFDACALITEGEIEISVAGAAQTYRVGDIFLVPAKTVHTEAAGPVGVQYLAGRRHVTAS